MWSVLIGLELEFVHKKLQIEYVKFFILMRLLNLHLVYDVLIKWTIFFTWLSDVDLVSSVLKILKIVHCLLNSHDRVIYFLEESV